MLNDIVFLKSSSSYSVGSYSITCYRHKWTHSAVNPSKQACVDLPTLERWKAELTSVTGYILRWFTCPQAVTHPGTNPAVHCWSSPTVHWFFTVENRQRLLHWSTPVTRSFSLVCLEILCPLLLPATFMSYQHCVRWLVVAVHRRPSSKLGSVFSSFCWHPS